MAEDWTATIAAERMEVDQEFSDRIESSSLNNQQWGLVMTALEFKIADPADPESARMVPDTSNLGAVMPELDDVGAGGRTRAGRDGGPGSDDGLFDSVKDAFGVGGDGDDERREEAERLASAYAERLQEKLEANGRWEDVRRSAQG